MGGADESGPDFSVVMCVRDGEALIGEALESLGRSTHDSFEVIVVDDGSTDATPRIADASPVVTTVLEVPSTGIAVARNTALAVARGRYVTFLDHDDLYHPTRLARIAEWLEANDHPAAVYTGMTAFVEASGDGVVRERGERLDTDWPRYRVAPGAALETLTGLCLGEGDTAASHPDTIDPNFPVSAPPGPALVVDRATLVAAGGSPVNLERASDFMLMMNLSRITPIIQIDQPTYFYRLRADSVTRRGGAHWPYLAAVISTRLGGTRMSVARAAGRAEALPRDRVFEDLLADEIRRGVEPGEIPLLLHALAIMYPRWRGRLTLGRRLLRDAVHDRAPRLARAVSRPRSNR